MGFFKSKEEKLLKQYEPAVADIFLRQIYEGIRESKVKEGVFFRMSTPEVHRYMFVFTDFYCRAILEGGDEIDANEFEKIYFKTLHSIWREVFNDEDMQKFIPAFSILFDGDITSLKDCWHNCSDDRDVKGVVIAEKHAQFDCKQLVQNDTFPQGLAEMLKCSDWEQLPEVKFPHLLEEAGWYEYKN